MGRRKKKSIAIEIISIIAAFILIILGYYFNVPPLNFDLGFGFKYSGEEVTNTPVTKVDGEFYISFIDVGQGDSILIEFADGKNMLIDGGNSETETADKILNYLATRNIKTLDYVLLTHTDEDHCGSLDKVIESDEILAKTVYMPYVRSRSENDPIVNGTAQISDTLKKIDISTPITDIKKYYYGYIGTANFADFVDAVIAEKSQIIYSEKGLKIEGEGYRITFVTPDPSMYEEVKGGKSDEINNVSPIIMLEANGTQVVLTGDAHKEAESVFITNYKSLGINPDCDVLKVGHHGSHSSCSDAFIKLIRPEIAVISAGKDNDYGHPHQVTLDTLLKYYAKIYCTIDYGTCLLTVKKDSYGFSTEKIVEGKFNINDNFGYRFGMAA